METTQTPLMLTPSIPALSGMGTKLSPTGCLPLMGGHIWLKKLQFNQCFGVKVNSGSLSLAYLHLEVDNLSYFLLIILSKSSVFFHFYSVTNIVLTTLYALPYLILTKTL